MQEEEAHQEEGISHEQEEEEVTDAEMDVTDAEMVGEEKCGDCEPSDPHGEADTQGPPPLDPVGDAVSPEEDTFLMQPASQSVDPTAGSHSPRSETGSLGRDGRVEPDLPEPTWAWGRRDSAVSLY